MSSALPFQDADRVWNEFGNTGHRGEQRVVKHSGASDRNFLAVSVEEAKGVFQGRAMQFSFPSQFVCLMR